MSVVSILSVTINILGNFSKVKSKSFYFFDLNWLAVLSVVLFWAFNLFSNAYLLQFLFLMSYIMCPKWSFSLWHFLNSFYRL